MKNNFQKIALITSTALLLLFSFAFVFTYQKINDNNGKTQQDTASLQIETFRRDDIASLNQSLQKITPDRVLLESHFIKTSDVVPFLNTIEKLAKEVGVLVQIDSIDVKTDNSELTFGFKASGGFEGIYKFLTLLENSPYEINFTSMDIHKNSSVWEAVFKIQLLSFIP